MSKKLTFLPNANSFIEEDLKSGVEDMSTKMGSNQTNLCPKPQQDKDSFLSVIGEEEKSLENESLIDGDFDPSRFDGKIESNLTKLVLVAWALLIFVGTVYYWGAVSHYLYTQVVWLFSQFERVPEPWRSLIFWTIAFICNVFCIPVTCIVFMVVSFIFGNYWWGYGLCLSATVASNLALYYFLKDSVARNQRATESASDQEFLAFLTDMLGRLVNTLPTLSAFFIRLMHIPDYLKIFLLVKFDFSFLHVILPCFVVESLNVFVYSFVGYQVKSKFDFFKAKSFSQKPLIEQIFSIMVSILLVVQIIVILFGAYFTAKKFREFQQASKERKMAQERVQKQLKIESFEVAVTN